MAGEIARGLAIVINELHNIDKTKRLMQDSQEKANGVASQTGYQEMITSPLLSTMVLNVLRPNPTRGQAQISQPLLNTPNSKKEQQSPKTETGKDPERTKISQGPVKPIRIGDTIADVLAKTFNFLYVQQQWHDKKIKDDKKYQKEVDKIKNNALDETIEAVGGVSSEKTKKKDKKIKKQKNGMSKEFMRGLYGAAFIGGDILLNTNWKEKFEETFKDAMKDFDLDFKFGNKEGTAAIGGTKAGDWSKDTEFLNKVNKYAEKKGIKASDLFGVMASESGMDPSKVAKSGATGLIQFMPETAKGLGTSTEELSKMTRSQQFDYVEKYLEKGGLKQGAKGSDIYAQVYLPARKSRDVLAEKGESYYESNKGLDIGNKGKITQEDLQARVESKKKEFYIEDTLSGTKSATSMAKLTPKNITSSFGKRTLEGVEKEHGGVDIKGKMGDTVVSSQDGKVSVVGFEAGGYGNYVEVDHGNGLKTRYAHLSKTDVNVGDMLSAGEKLGEVGSTGHSTGPHLHYELLQNGKKVDVTQSESFNLNPVVEDYQLASADKSYGETQNMKKMNKMSGAFTGTTIIDNTTNIIRPGNIYAMQQEQTSSYSPLIELSYGYR